MYNIQYLLARKYIKGATGWVDRRGDAVKLTMGETFKRYEIATQNRRTLLDIQELANKGWVREMMPR